MGAGTGIFTKCLLETGVRDLVAIEPNNDMRNAGRSYLGESIDFINGSGEKPLLESKKYNLVTMASSFHWPDTNLVLKEFDRILKDDGVFAALWNLRLTERSPIESKIQIILTEKYNLKSRVSSGLSDIASNLRDILSDNGIFKSVLYVDAVEFIKRTCKKYMGAWRSVNDIQVELGAKNFAELLGGVEKIISNFPNVKVHYLTRAWIASK